MARSVAPTFSLTTVEVCIHMGGDGRSSNWHRVQSTGKAKPGRTSAVDGPTASLCTVHTLNIIGWRHIINSFARPMIVLAPEHE